jgi:hypothetical protein
MKMGGFLRFSPLSAGSSVLDDLWIVAIILEQPAYALIVPSRPILWLCKRSSSFDTDWMRRPPNGASNSGVDHGQNGFDLAKTR